MCSLGKINRIFLLPLTVVLIVVTGIPLPGIAQTNSASLGITVTVQEHTCTITGADDGGLTFELATVSVHDFDKAAGQSVGEVIIPIVFSDCVSGINGVAVKVTGESAGNTTAFKNTLDGNDSGGATGIGVNFYDTDGKTLIPSGTDVSATEQKFGREGITLNYKASYTRVSEKVSAGNLHATLTLRFIYI